MNARLVTFLNQLISETTVFFFFLIVNVDGFMINATNWQEMHRQFNLRIFLFFGVTETQWGKKKPPAAWTPDHWNNADEDELMAGYQSENVVFEPTPPGSCEKCGIYLGVKKSRPR